MVTGMKGCAISNVSVATTTATTIAATIPTAAITARTIGAVAALADAPLEVAAPIGAVRPRPTIMLATRTALSICI